MNNEAGIGKPSGPPVNDPIYSKQASYLEAINVPAAWRRLTSTRVKRKKVTVALIDSGVKPDHPDLVGNLVTGYNVIRHNTNTSDPNGHGTNMAGVFGATINNSVGIAGVMDLVNILPISVENYFIGDHSDSFDYAIRNKKTRDISIILMAISGGIFREGVANKIKEAVKAGMLVIVTAGNKGKNITTDKAYPCALTAQLPGMLCVAGTENTEMKLAPFSDYANYVDIAAPGADIATTGIATGTNRFAYEIVGGTSPASAIIAGVAAMLYSLAPNLTPADVKKIIKDTSTKGLKDSTGKTTFPFGRVDADKAVAKLIPR
ncbi:hypothetical protein FOL47_009556 [Perkinsus chesapeaki]|uniref:subtilisin n=1 Tax=Perkinsus chesapeaki TaxID=330153 RepID=A0A7J6L7K2_PERCH|nr:hypothetical protein FOL47_009556 [Perkinsus chesapeaki]